MAKQIILDSDLGEARFDFRKLDREKVYGKRTRVMLDNDGEPCSRASLTADGSLLIQAGMTAQGYFDEEGTWIENKDLVGIQDGVVLDLVPSTLGVSQKLTPAKARDLLDSRIYAIYTLDPDEVPEALKARLEAGEIFSAPFNYRPDYRPEVSFIVHNDEGFFALVGNPAPPRLGRARPARLPRRRRRGRRLRRRHRLRHVLRASSPQQETPCLSSARST